LPAPVGNLHSSRLTDLKLTGKVRSLGRLHGQEVDLPLTLAGHSKEEGVGEVSESQQNLEEAMQQLDQINGVVLGRSNQQKQNGDVGDYALRFSKGTLNAHKDLGDRLTNETLEVLLDIGKNIWEEFNDLSLNFNSFFKLDKLGFPTSTEFSDRKVQSLRNLWQNRENPELLGGLTYGFIAGGILKYKGGDRVPNKTGAVSGAQWNEYLTSKYGAENVFWDWPKNKGFVYGADEIGSLQPGQLIGRLGNERGTFASPLGTTPETLSLRPGTDVSNLNVYRVLQEIPDTRIGPAAPAFDMPGYGTQYELPKSVKELLNPANQYLERVTK